MSAGEGLGQPSIKKIEECSDKGRLSPKRTPGKAPEVSNQLHESGRSVGGKLTNGWPQQGLRCKKRIVGSRGVKKKQINGSEFSFDT